MAHSTVRQEYQKLVSRINRFPQGAPPSELLFKILEMLFSRKEAELVSLLPIKPFKPKDASRIWKLSLVETKKNLDELANRAVLLDIEKDGESVYSLPPPMAGFFEFSMMRVRNDIDQKLLSELFYQYLNVEADFIKALFTQGETQLGRVFVNESAISGEIILQVLDYEIATEVIRSAKCIGVGICYCRHKMKHLGKVCDAPMDICMTFNSTAKSLTKHGVARKIETSECLDLLNLAYEYNLVQFGENVRKDVNFICNCCSCCCEAMIAARRFGMLNPVHTTNFIPHIDEATCNGCGKCVNVCPVEAMTLMPANNPHKQKMKRAKLDEETCLGCGVCFRVCDTKSINLKMRKNRVIPPLNGTHKAVVMAIERGKLQNLIFDNQAYLSHRIMAAVLGTILKLPPIKQTMASKQMKSRYLEALISSG
jgi:ferredoxin